MKEIYFDEIKEPRDRYFVRYCPPGGDVPFALLSLVFSEPVASEDAKSAMETEASLWLNRYNIPVMITGFGPDGRVVRIHSSIDRDHLIAWDDDSGRKQRHWELVEEDRIPKAALNTDTLLSVYHDVPYRTDQEVKAAATENFKEQRKGRRLLVALIFMWAVVVPAAIAILGWASPFIGAAATVYALVKAGREGAVLLGFASRTTRERDESEKRRRMEHYYYHCERNPEAFERLKAENFRSDSRKRRKQEAEALTKPSRATR